jgi:essential nuclear protein 1
MPKVKKEKASQAQRHDPLANQILHDEATAGLRATPRAKRLKKDKEDGGDEDDMKMIPPAVSRKILEAAREQKEEDDNEDENKIPGDTGSIASIGSDDEVEEMSDVEVDEDGYIIHETMSAEDERALEMFLPKATDNAPKARTLADVILEKIQEKETQQHTQQAEEERQGISGLSPKVVETYCEIAVYLSRYKAGKIPKAFKVIANLKNWEEVLYLTKPVDWRPAAMYQAVRIFISNLNPRNGQRFLNLVLLPAIREDIADHKRLNFNYYQALKKSVFKPAAFFKGILLPLVSENCTLKEAVILASILAKVSIPVMHAAAVLVKLCQMTPWYGTTSIFIATLVNKKYALPMRTIEALCQHFCAFENDDRELPVIWHRSMLLFIQRYKFDLDQVQRKALKNLLKVHYHEAIGVEVRRELAVPIPGQAPNSSMDIG